MSEGRVVRYCDDGYTKPHLPHPYFNGVSSLEIWCPGRNEEPSDNETTETTES